MPRNIVTNITNDVLENREPILEEPNNEAVISVAIKNGYDLSDGADAHQAAVDALTSSGVEEPPEIKVTTEHPYMEPTLSSGTIAQEATVVNVIDPIPTTSPASSISPMEQPVSGGIHTPPRYNTRRDRKVNYNKLNKGITADVVEKVNFTVQHIHHMTLKEATSRF